MKKLRVLITGVHGLVGFTVYRYLRMQPHKYDVAGLDTSDDPSDRLKTVLSERSSADGNVQAPDAIIKAIYDELHNQQGRFFKVDLTGPKELIRAAVSGVNIVLHFAGNPNPEQTADITMSNVLGTCQLFECCASQSVSRVVFASSIRVMKDYHDDLPFSEFFKHGRQLEIEDGVRLKESTSPKPPELYSLSKIWQEELGRMYARHLQFSCLCLRIGWVNGDDTPQQHDMIWSSQRDVCQAVERAICSPMSEDFQFDIFFANSDSSFHWISTAKARDKLGYIPMDYHESYLEDR